MDGLSTGVLLARLGLPIMSYSAWIMMYNTGSLSSAIAARHCSSVGLAV
jgi:hypothetical protein